VFRGETVTCNCSHTQTQNILLCLGEEVKMGLNKTRQLFPLCVWEILKAQKHKDRHTPFVRGAALPYNKEAVAVP